MRNPVLLLLLIAATAGFADAGKETVLPLDQSRNKAHVKVRVGSVVIPDILLDTGFTTDGLLIYNPVYRDSLDLAGAMEAEVGGAGAGGRQKALMLDSADLYLGDLRLTNQRVVMLQSDIYKGFPSNGVIGYSLFGHFLTEIDNDNNTMTLRDSAGAVIDESWASVPLYFRGSLVPWVDASVAIEDEAPQILSTYIDYAAGDAILLLEKPGMRFHLPENTEDVFLGRGLSGDIYGKQGKIAKLIIGPYELNDVMASFADAEVRSKQADGDAILGVGSLRRFNLIFDYANNKLYLKPNRHFAQPFD